MKSGQSGSEVFFSSDLYWEKRSATRGVLHLSLFSLWIIPSKSEELAGKRWKVKVGGEGHTCCGKGNFLLPFYQGTQLLFMVYPPPQLMLNPSARKSRSIQYLATSFPGTQVVVSSREDLLWMIYTGEGDKSRNQIYSFSLMGISLSLCVHICSVCIYTHAHARTHTYTHTLSPKQF